MPRGGWYRGRGWRSYGSGWGRRPLAVLDDVSAGDTIAEYVGPCRCGTGPHAYYRTTSGRLVRAPYGPRLYDTTADTSQSEIDSLRDENRKLEERIRQPEGKLADK